MKFNLEAAKAYVGAAVAGAALKFSGFVIGLFEAGTGIDLPVNVETVITYGITAIIGYMAVYWTPNAKPAT